MSGSTADSNDISALHLWPGNLKHGIYMLAENIGTQVRENTGISIDL